MEEESEYKAIKILLMLVFAVGLMIIFFLPPLMDLCKKQ